MRSGRKLTQKKILCIYWQSTWQPQSSSGTIGQLAADEDTSWCCNVYTVPSGRQGIFSSYHVVVKGTDSQSHWNETTWCQNFSKRFVSFSATFHLITNALGLGGFSFMCRRVKSFCDDLFFQGLCRRSLCNLLEQGWVRHDSLFYS